MGRLAGEHLVGHRGERIDVAPAVDDPVAGGLLRAHVLRGAEREPGLGDPVAAGLAHRERDAEVGHHRLAVLEEDVLGLEIPVDHAVPVRVIERVGAGDGDAEGVVHRELLLPLEPGAERFPLHERHHVEEMPVGLAAVEQGEQIGVLEIRRDLDLGEEPLDAQHRTELGIQQLERHGTVVAQIAGEIDRGHAAGADLALDGVAVRQGFFELGEDVHGIPEPSRRGSAPPAEFDERSIIWGCEASTRRRVT